MEIKEASLIGYKAARLLYLKEHGFPVPDFIVLDINVYREVIGQKGREEKVREIIAEIKKDGAGALGERRDSLFADMELSEDVLAQIREFISEENAYAVRSSGIMEDKGEHSFAGLYESYLRINNIEEIKTAIKASYRALFSRSLLQYISDYSMEFSELGMALIIQQMVEAKYSGVAFTVNPLTGEDKKMLIEISEGIGEKLLNGKKRAHRLVYDWKEKRVEESEDGKDKVFPEILTREMLDTLLKIQIAFGYPCDIEFAIHKCRLYILQARPITKIQYQNMKDIWTTANFRDGGVASSVCTPYMASLYEYSFGPALAKFVEDSRLLPKSECGISLCKMFFGRVYWNLSFVKRAMSRVIGYKERDFDTTYGIRMKYEGDGERTPITLRSLLRMIRIAIAQYRMVKDNTNTAVRNREDLLKLYNTYIAKAESLEAKEEGRKKGLYRENLEAIWLKLIWQDYRRAESRYFRQVFINTVQQAMHKGALSAHLCESDYLGLMSAIEDVSHLRPFYRLWEIGRKIRSRKSGYEYWSSNSPEVIFRNLEQRKEERDDIELFIKDFAYHSKRELDPSYPCYAEDGLFVIKMLREQVLLEEEYNPKKDGEKQRKIYLQKLEKLRNTVGDRKYKKLKKTIDYMRSLLWWREEFKDISTRFYYLIRLYTLKLAKIYFTEGILEKPEDIWMLGISDIRDFIEKKIRADELAERIGKNRDYYLSFRNDAIRNELGGESIESEEEKIDSSTKLSGLGCSRGRARGRARVLRDIKEIDRLEKDDILIAKYTDTGWTPKFATLAGIVTEYGGVLCHAAVISREYGIPCIVAVEGALEKIKDGSMITIDGANGEIHIIKTAD